MTESDFIKVANLARIRAAEVIIWQIAPGEGVTEEELRELTSKLEAIAERITERSRWRRSALVSPRSPLPPRNCLLLLLPKTALCFSGLTFHRLVLQLLDL